MTEFCPGCGYNMATADGYCLDCTPPGDDQCGPDDEYGECGVPNPGWTTASSRQQPPPAPADSQEPTR